MSSAVGVVAVKVASDSGQKVLYTAKSVKWRCLIWSKGAMIYESIWLHDVEKVFL